MTHHQYFEHYEEHFEQDYFEESYLEEDPAPDDTPYNDWERYPWRWPGNNGPIIL